MAQLVDFMEWGYPKHASELRFMTLFQSIGYVCQVFGVLALGGILASCAGLSSLPEENHHESIDLCILTSSSSFEEEVNIIVRGKIGGYHELFLYSDDCPGNEALIELQLTEEERLRLMTMSEPYQQGKTDIEGKIVVSGRFHRWKGRLFTYPARPVDLDKHQNDGQMLVVHKITDGRIVYFVPN